MKKLRQAVLCLTVLTISCFCFVVTKASAEQTNNKNNPQVVGKTTQTTTEKKPTKNIFGEDAKKTKKRQGWAEKELRKEGITPGEVSDSEYRRILGAE